MKIDLGQKPHETALPASPNTVAKGPYYPCANAYDLENLEVLETGSNLPATIRVKSLTKEERDGKVKWSAEFEIIDIETKGDGDKPKKDKKASTKEDEDAIETGLKEVEKEKKYGDE